MQSLITWIALGLGTLFFGACVVAWWEHLGRDVKGTEEPDWDAPPRQLATVDVELDILAAAPAASVSTAAGDVRERRQTLGGAMTRMASGDRRQSFGDTVPMILAGGPSEVTGVVEKSPAEAATSDVPLAAARQRDRATAGE